jgi:hypothetical protein
VKSTIFRSVAIFSAVFATFGTPYAVAQSGSTPCGLLTSAQVSAAVGATVGNAEPIATTGCTWSWGRATTTLSLWDASKWDRMKSSTLPGVTKSSVSGLGDDAFSATMGTSKQFAVLNVKKGATVYIFKVYGIESPSDQLSIEKTLAADVLAKVSAS